MIIALLSGYYGEIGAPFVRLYMDTMHAAVDETNDHLIACCTPPPAGINKTYLTPEALLVSAGAFSNAVTALNASAAAGSSKAAVYRERVGNETTVPIHRILSWEHNVNLPGTQWGGLTD
jgi:hypothetical protein